LLFLSLGIALKITLLEFQALYILFLQQKNWSINKCFSF
jgi:hypothetical protein